MAKRKLNTFQKQVQLSPDGHALSVAMSMLGIAVDIQTADMILLAVKGVNNNMSLDEAVKTRISHEKKWSSLKNSETDK